MISDRFSNFLAYQLNSIKVSAISQDDDEDVVSATEVDSHADSPVVGKYARNILVHNSNKQ